MSHYVSIFVSLLSSPSDPLAADIQSTLLHLNHHKSAFDTLGLTESCPCMYAYLIKTWPRVPVLLRSMNSSVSLSCMFMYESTLTRRPLYSVCPHFNRMMTSSLILSFALQSVIRSRGGSFRVRRIVQLLQHRPRVFGGELLRGQRTSKFKVRMARYLQTLRPQ